MSFLRLFALPVWQRGFRPLTSVSSLSRIVALWTAVRIWLPVASLWASFVQHWREFRSPVPFGLQGERAAERYLRRQGYAIVDRRARGGLGEIDLVAVDQRTIVFVEVKSRRSHHRGHPAEAVDPRKQRRLTRLALSWLKRHDLLEHRARFDVVAITWPKTERSPTIKHIRNAFEAAGDGQMFC